MLSKQLGIEKVLVRCRDSRESGLGMDVFIKYLWTEGKE